MSTTPRSARGRSVAFAPEPTTSAASLWGAEAVRALRNGQCASSSSCAGSAADEQLLTTVRERVGPYASEGALRHFLRTSHGKAHWATNGALREAVLAAGENGVPADFEPAAHVPARQGQVSDCAGELESSSPPLCAVLPVVLWELVLSFCDANDVRSAATTCSVLRAAASSQSLWGRLYSKRWGAWPCHDAYCLF